MRGLLILLFVGALVYVAATVDIGERTLVEHVQNIWGSDEAQELVKGIEESSGPVLERLERGVRAGMEEAARPDSGDGSDVAPGARDEGAEGQPPGEGTRAEFEAGAPDAGVP